MVILGKIIYFLFFAYIVLIVNRVLLSFIYDPQRPFMLFLVRATDPALNLGRRIFPFHSGGIDFSVIFTIFLLWFCGFAAVAWLESMAIGDDPQIIFLYLAVFPFVFISQLAFVLIIFMISRIIVSLAQLSPFNSLALVAYKTTEPLLAPMRGLFPQKNGGLDLGGGGIYFFSGHGIA